MAVIKKVVEIETNIDELQELLARFAILVEQINSFEIKVIAKKPK